MTAMAHEPVATDHETLLDYSALETPEGFRAELIGGGAGGVRGEFRWMGCPAKASPWSWRSRRASPGRTASPSGAAFARAGIPLYLLVDRKKSALTLFSDPTADDYVANNHRPLRQTPPPPRPLLLRPGDDRLPLNPEDPGPRAPAPELPLPPWPMTSVPSARSTSPSGAST